jgi:hypothetical protein
MPTASTMCWGLQPRMLLWRGACCGHSWSDQPCAVGGAVFSGSLCEDALDTAGGPAP